MTHSQRRARLIIVLIAVVIAAVAAACSAQVSVGASGGGSPDSTAATATAGGEDGGAAVSEDGGAVVARGATGSDMTRILHALGSMSAETPDRPLVVLLGGSAARESTISDNSWRRQIVAEGGPAAFAWNMGSGNRTMAQNVAIVRALPEGAQAIVLIGINLGAFTSSQKSASLPSPLPTSPPSLQQPHRYSTKTGILSTAKKRALLKNWLTKRYPVYKRNFKSSAAVLETLIKVCMTRGYKPVLFELPRNTAVIGSSLNAPTKRFRDKCRSLRTKYGIPWVSLPSKVKIRNSAFYDLWHLVEPGRKVWQRQLSIQTATLLERYGYDGGGS